MDAYQNLRCPTIETLNFNIHRANMRPDESFPNIYATNIIFGVAGSIGYAILKL